MFKELQFPFLSIGGALGAETQRIAWLKMQESPILLSRWASKHLREPIRAQTQTISPCYTAPCTFIHCEQQTYNPKLLSIITSACSFAATHHKADLWFECLMSSLRQTLWPWHFSFSPSSKIFFIKRSRASRAINLLAGFHSIFRIKSILGRNCRLSVA